MEFNYNHSTKLYTVNSHSLPTSQYMDKLAAICCELLLASEDLLYFQEITKQKYIDPLLYFSPPLLQDFLENPSICPITDAVDFCASNRDAILLSRHNSSFDSTYYSPTQSVSSQSYQPGGRNSENDTPNSSLSDTQYHSRISNCSDELFQSRISESNSDLHESVKPPIVSKEPKFISRAFQHGAGNEFFSLNERVNDNNEDLSSTYQDSNSVVSRDGSNDHLLSQSVNIGTGERVRMCPQCKREIDSRSQVCQSCRLYIA